MTFTSFARDPDNEWAGGWEDEWHPLIVELGHVAGVLRKDEATKMVN